MYTRSIRCARVSLSQFRIFSDLSACSYSSNSQEHQNNYKKHLTSSEAQKDDKKSSNTYSRSGNRTEQTVSGETNHIAQTETAYDKDAVYPDQAIEKMKKKNNQDSLDYSAANPDISVTTKDSSVPDRK
ncbi:7376_t:CDS:2 [Dentiscutata heterogama]|uniref:7376_t:CDS:1 n=1 Tax=Dentiscutata heterogama TaxID=1316150 RepID=A0ACA9KIZ8_9GLOM|nr:7376_t:CDS:2 [Dentiscutata heterogama]